MVLRRQLLLALVLSLAALVSGSRHGSFVPSPELLDSVESQERGPYRPRYNPSRPYAEQNSYPFPAAPADRYQEPPSVLPVENTQCTATELRNMSIPFNALNLDHFEVIGVSTYPENCFTKCCGLGPLGCQYIWIFGNVCFAVACRKTNAANCLPKKTNKIGVHTYYLTVSYSIRDEEDGKPTEDEFESDLDHVHPSSSSSSILAADAGPERLIRLPTNEIFLLGNGSHGGSTNAIARYQWMLTSTHAIPPILLNADTAILHAVNLQEGDYNFKLTVTDSIGHTSSDTTTVHVIGTATIPSSNAPPSSSSSTPTVTTEIAPNSNATANQTTPSVPAPDAGEEGAEEEEEEGEEVGRESEEGDDSYSKKRNMIRIVVPTLLTVAFILIASASVVGVIACVCERNRRKMKLHYKYKRLPGTVEKI